VVAGILVIPAIVVAWSLIAWSLIAWPFAAWSLVAWFGVAWPLVAWFGVAWPLIAGFGVTWSLLAWPTGFIGFAVAVAALVAIPSFTHWRSRPLFLRPDRNGQQRSYRHAP
jgi:hypothetical protein